MTTKVRSSVLADTAVTPEKYGGTQTLQTITVDAQGRITHAANITSGVVTADTTGQGASILVPSIRFNALGQIVEATNTTIRSATTSVTGVVQLVDSVSSTSTTSAATGSAVKTAYDDAQANTGAGLITTKAAYEANTGAGLITTKAAYEANVGVARLAATLTTSSNPQFNTLGLGTAPNTGQAGSIRMTGDIEVGYSDDNLKTRLGNIENALDKVSAISGFFYEPNQVAQDLGYQVKREVGVSAQEIQAVLPEVVIPAPIDDRYLTVKYDRLVPLLIEAIKELTEKVEVLENKIKDK